MFDIVLTVLDLTFVNMYWIVLLMKNTLGDAFIPLLIVVNSAVILFKTWWMARAIHKAGRSK